LKSDVAVYRNIESDGGKLAPLYISMIGDVIV
jgi:hypothetical protein